MTAPDTDTLIRAAVTQLTAAGVENGRQEARWLLEHAAKIRPGALPQTMRSDIADLFQSLIDRRAAREPLQHIIGRTYFHDFELKSDARALIPREDSYAVVRLALSALGDTPDIPCTVADLGTGSGVLLAAALRARAHAKGIAVERSAKALSLAKENFDTLGLSDRTSCFEGSWADWTGWGLCELIISNPPYIASAILPSLAPEVRDHDPSEALDGGNDGLDAYREIIALAAQNMKPASMLALEIGYDQKAAVTALLLTAGFINLRHQKDFGGHDRAIAAIKP